MEVSDFKHPIPSTLPGAQLNTLLYHMQTCGAGLRAYPKAAQEEVQEERQAHYPESEV